MQPKSLIREFYNTLQPSIAKAKDKYTDYRIKPSSLGTKCLRKLYYDSWKVPNDFDVPQNVKKMGAMGDGIAHILSNKFRERKILIDYYMPDGSYQKGFQGEPNLEFPLSNDILKIKIGYIDAVFILDGKLWIGEYKSATSNSFKKLAAPKPDHLIQATTYLIVFNKILAEGGYSHIKELKGFTQAEGVIFLYVDRDTAVDFQMKEFPISLQQATETFKHTVHKTVEFKKFADSKTLPPKTPEWCNSCNWRLKCEQNFNI